MRCPRVLPPPVRCAACPCRSPPTKTPLSRPSRGAGTATPDRSPTTWRSRAPGRLLSRARALAAACCASPGSTSSPRAATRLATCCRVGGGAGDFVCKWRPPPAMVMRPFATSVATFPPPWASSCAAPTPWRPPTPRRGSPATRNAQSAAPPRFVLMRRQGRYYFQKVASRVLPGSAAPAPDSVVRELPRTRTPSSLHSRE
mmetsp:Transcript_44424/g.104646  ORF Transcript_44424/g.104646 Transcript_44424/m.104646 type:complete len:201 (-) Transcript_44424:45-647(-)